MQSNRNASCWFRCFYCNLLKLNRESAWKGGMGKTLSVIHARSQCARSVEPFTTVYQNIKKHHAPASFLSGWWRRWKRARRETSEQRLWYACSRRIVGYCFAIINQFPLSMLLFRCSNLRIKLASNFNRLSCFGAILSYFELSQRCGNRTRPANLLGFEIRTTAQRLAREFIRPVAQTQCTVRHCFRSSNI